MREADLVRLDGVEIAPAPTDASVRTSVIIDEVQNVIGRRTRHADLKSFHYGAIVLGTYRQVSLRNRSSDGRRGRKVRVIIRRERERRNSVVVVKGVVIHDPVSGCQRDTISDVRPSIVGNIGRRGTERSTYFCYHRSRRSRVEFEYRIYHPVP